MKLHIAAPNLFWKTTRADILASRVPHGSLRMPKQSAWKGLPKAQEAALNADQSYGLPVACPSRSCQSNFGYQCPESRMLHLIRTSLQVETRT